MNRARRSSALFATALAVVITPRAPAQTKPHEVREPATSQHNIESEHFVARWSDKDKVRAKPATIRNGLAELEKVRSFYCGELGFPEPYAGAEQRFKTDINLSDQGWASGSGIADVHPAMWVNYLALRDPSTLAHEFAHCLQFTSRGFRDSPFVGWFWECHAEWMTFQMYPRTALQSHQLVDAPHLYYGSTRNRYGNWQFLEFLKDTYGYPAINALWTESRRPGDPEQATEDPLLALRRTRGWSQAELGDHFGRFAMANVTWDYQRGEVFRSSYGSYTDRRGSRRNRVTRLDRRPDGSYRVPEYWAPQRYGYNLVRLEPQPGATTIVVDFRGRVQQQAGPVALRGDHENEPNAVGEPASDWRWGVVAVDGDGRGRRSELQRGASAKLTFALRDGERELWLVVAATPTEHHSIAWDQAYYTIYRYPWSVRLDGARPWGSFRELPDDIAGAPHGNGGGFVAATAEVVASAYVGPDAVVLDHAKVEANARVEGLARVTGRAVVRGHAQLRDRAEASGSAEIADHAVIEHDATIRGGRVHDRARIGALTIVDGDDTDIGGSVRIAAVMHTLSNVRLTGSVQLLGDLELHAAPSAGVFYGYVPAEWIADPRHGASRTEPAAEVTAPWRD
jgi:hypothetical protein